MFSKHYSGRIDDFLIALRSLSPKTFNEIMINNGIFGIYRIKLDYDLDKRLEEVRQIDSV